MHNCEQEKRGTGRRRLPALWGLLIAVTLAAVPSPGRAAASERSERSEHRSIHAEEAKHKNSVGVIAAGSTEFADETVTAVVLGVEYERHFTDVWGLAAFAEYNFGDFKRSALLGAGVTARPIGALRLLGAACAEFVEASEPAHDPSHSADGGHDTHSVFRLAAAYEFEYDRYIIAPTLSIDFAGETKTILGYGVLFGYSF